MNYIKQINGFWNWVQLNGISHGEMILYMAILHCANISKWKSSLTIPNSTLQSLTKISDRSQLNKTRNRLVQTGLIHYEKGSKGKAGTYTVTDLCGKYDTHSDTNNIMCGKYDTGLDTTLDTGLDTTLDTGLDTIYKQNKTKQNIIDNSSSIPAPMKSDVPQDLIDCYQNNISRNFITPIEHDNLEYWCGKVEPDVVKYAIGEAVSHSAANWSYIKRILENHYNAGRTTLDAVKSAKPRRGKDAGICESSNGMTDDEIEKLIREKM